MDGEFHFFEGNPEDLRRMMEERAAQNQMAYDDAVHTLYRTIEEIDVEHLKQIKALIHNLGDTPQALGFWEGVIASAIARREKVCPACGKDHDKELESWHAQQNADPKARGDLLIKMHEYHVEPVDDENLNGPVRCTGILGMAGGCGVTYPSLEDRMLRKPDECSGCFARSAQG